MMRSTFVLAMTLLVSGPRTIRAQLLTPAATGSAQPTRPVLTLAVLEQRALSKNPTLAQADAEVAAARGRAKQAGLLPNPTIGYSADEVSRGPVIRGGEHGLFVEQTIPLGGKLGLSRRVFERQATQAEALVAAQRGRILTDVRMLYYTALAAQRRVEVRERLAGLAAEAVGVSRQLYNTGAADQPDVLASEIEARQTQLMLEAAQNDRYRVWRRLASMVGDIGLAPQALDGSIDATLPEIDRDAILGEILTQSPDMKATRLAVDQAQAALKRARRETAPDLVVRGGPRYNRELLEANGQPVGWEASFDVGLVVPLFNRNQGGIAEAGAELGRAQHEVDRLELELRSGVADAFDQYLTALRSAEAYRSDVLPRAEQSYQQYLARYRQGAAAYPQVLIAQRTLFQATDQYIDAAASAWTSALALQGWLLTGGLDSAASPSLSGERRTSSPSMTSGGGQAIRP
jgi:cobalt-zinc-cadmium efflux system outer membrane protein